MKSGFVFFFTCKMCFVSVSRYKKKLTKRIKRDESKDRSEIYCWAWIKFSPEIEGKNLKILTDAKRKKWFSGKKCDILGSTDVNDILLKKVKKAQKQT